MYSKMMSKLIIHCSCMIFVTSFFKHHSYSVHTLASECVFVQIENIRLSKINESLNNKTCYF